MSADTEIREFFDKHCAGGGVILVIIIGDEGEYQYGVFRSYNAASAWKSDEDVQRIFTPYIIDDPEWGDRTKSKVQ